MLADYVTAWGKENGGSAMLARSVYTALLIFITAEFSHHTADNKLYYQSGIMSVSYTHLTLPTIYSV